MKKILFLIIFTTYTTFTFAEFGYDTGVLKGQNDKYICNIQEFLIKYDYLRIKKPTCYFGSLTEQAIKEFQEDASLKITGKWDWDTMNEYKRVVDF